jgi:DNA-binding XRE family transcriptional regulator
MAVMSDWTRAGQAAAARRGELELTQGQLAARADVDAKTIYNLEVAGRKPIARNRSRIETALEWPHGRLERIANEAEHEPEPGHGSDADAAADELERNAAQMLAAARILRAARRRQKPPNGKANGDETRRAG